MSSFNLTKTRAAALRIIQQRPAMDAHSLAYHLFEGDHIKWHDKYFSDQDKFKVNIEPQASARWSSGFLAPLIREGLVRKNTYSGPAHNGRAVLYITEKGKNALLKDHLGRTGDSDAAD